ncbi:MAG TPA: cation:proton antiporter [Gemmatimonadales bacterium]|nr:cation:proton antiporter [Gemmatimonadales bacterium]
MPDILLAMPGAVPALLARLAPEGAGNFGALLLALAAMLATAKILGDVCETVGQPAVLGEMLAGILLGPSVVGLVDPHAPEIYALGEIGVIILLFQIGLETDLRKLMAVGGAAAAVAFVGVAVPFALGYYVSLLLGLEQMVALVMGAALTATSVGITARVLSDLGRLQDPESQVVLGAAVIDDVVGLVILAVVGAMVAGGPVTPLLVGRLTLTAFGFILAALVVGRFVVPRLFDALDRHLKGPSLPLIALTVAFLVALLAKAVGSALIIGAFTAGLLFGGTKQHHAIEKGVVQIGYFFVPLFFVTVGALVNVRDFADPRVLLVGGVITVCAVVGKVVAGYAPFWFAGRKLVIGVGMVPRGEVGLIFASMGLGTGVFDSKLFAAAALMVMATTFLAPVVLRALLAPKAGPPAPDEDLPGSTELVSRV